MRLVNVQTGGIKGERKKLPRTLSDTPDPKAQRRCVRTYAEDTKTGNGAAAADDFCVVPLCIELCPFAETKILTDDSGQPADVDGIPGGTQPIPSHAQ
jgi:hypothetical protein